MKFTNKAMKMTPSKNPRLGTAKKRAGQLDDSLEKQIAKVDQILDQDSKDAIEDYEKAAGKLLAGRSPSDRVAISYRLRELGMKNR